MAAVREVFADTTPLRNPHFRRLWQANIITVIGAQLTVVAVPAQIYAMTQDSGYVGLTGLFGLVPLIVFGLWGGALADHFDRRTVLIITTLGLIVTSALFYLLALQALGVGGLAGGKFADVEGQVVVEPAHVQKALAAHDRQQMFKPLGQWCLADFLAEFWGHVSHLCMSISVAGKISSCSGPCCARSCAR